MQTILLTRPSTYTCGPLSRSGKGDTLRALLRDMEGAGLLGPAQVVDERGMVCLHIKSIQVSAKYSLTELKDYGFRLGKYVENPFGARENPADVE